VLNGRGVDVLKDVICYGVFGFDGYSGLELCVYLTSAFTSSFMMGSAFFCYYVAWGMASFSRISFGRFIYPSLDVFPT
jgi:hypothetical protein